MANGEEQLLVITEQRLVSIVEMAVENALTRLDMATAIQLRKELEKTRYKLADAETLASTRLELSNLRAEKAARLEQACDELKEEKFKLIAKVAMLESAIGNLEATIENLKAGEVTAGNDE